MIYYFTIQYYITIYYIYEQLMNFGYVTVLRIFFLFFPFPKVGIDTELTIMKLVKHSSAHIAYSQILHIQIVLAGLFFDIHITHLLSIPCLINL